MKLKLLMTIVISSSALSLNACPKTENTPLTQQYETGALQWRVVRKDIDPHTLIHQAILENSGEVIKFLLAQGVDVDYPDEHGMSPLTIAILNRSSDTIKVLLSNGANTNPAVKWNNKSLLELAFYMHDWDVAKKLIDHGANVNGDADNGWSLLSHFIQTDNPDFIALAKNMINQGAIIRSQEVYSAIMYSEHRSDLSLLEMLIQKGVDLNKEEPGFPTLIVEASRRWNPEVIKLLAKSGANLNKLDKLGVENTALIVAICSGKVERVKLLVSLGADVNQKGFRNGVFVSPIEYALEYRCPEIVQYLLLQGARN